MRVRSRPCVVARSRIRANELQRIHPERCRALRCTQRSKDYSAETTSMSPTITPRFHSFNYIGSYRTLNKLAGECTVTWLWPTDFTLSWILKCKRRNASMSCQDLSHYFRADVSTEFLAIAKFVECFANLTLSRLTSSINKKWSAGLPSIQITPCQG